MYMYLSLFLDTINVNKYLSPDFERHYDTWLTSGNTWVA